MVDLHLDGVTKAYGGVSALREVALDVADGEFFTLVGPSGCGKTTTLRLVAGFEEPTRGTVRFGDRPMTGVPPEDRDVGVVFQHYALFPHMTVRENVAYGLRFRDPPGGASRRERVDDLLDLVDLPGMGDRSPDALSGGQAQRVALARALAPGPEVLLLDEPMSALDARLRERLRVEVRAIQSELSITTLYVTHDQAEALAISDRVAVMDDGRIEQVGTPEAVYREPATRFVAGFVGDNNLFDASVVAYETEGSLVRVERAGVAPGGGPARTDVAGADTAEAGADATRAGVDATRTGAGVAGAEDDTAGTGTDAAGAVEFRLPPLGGEPPADGAVTFCVRPEDLAVGGGTNELTAAVEHVEFLGDAYRVHCRWNGRPLLARTRERPGRELRLGFEPADVHVLDGPG